jgi:hypothetical protein
MLDRPTCDPFAGRRPALPLPAKSPPTRVIESSGGERYDQCQFGIHSGRVPREKQTAQRKEIIMTGELSRSMIMVAIASALKTPWGEPDLQGIWTDEFDTPLQRPSKYANQEFFTGGRAPDRGQSVRHRRPGSGSLGSEKGIPDPKLG